MPTPGSALFENWTPAVDRVLRRAVTLARTDPVSITTIVDALDTDVLPAPDAALPLGLTFELDRHAHDVLRAANHLRLASGRSQIHLVDLVGALADATFAFPDPALVRRRRFLCERLVVLAGGSTAAVPALLTIAEQFSEAPSTLVSR